MAEETREKTNFIWEAIKADIAEGKNGGRVQTRFPPEPNGYLHIGHVKALSVDFLTAERFGGVCNLRFDDTNPTKEKEEFVEAIKDDIHWLGFNYANVYYASEQYDQIYEFALDLIRRGLAYVDDLSKEEIREYRGTLTQPGKNSPYRDRTPEENMDLFLRMKNGEFPEGSRVLRAKIDMASPNINMRDPTIYRIKYCTHHRTGDKWCIYPMYDFAHPIGDALEGVTAQDKRLIDLLDERKTPFMILVNKIDLVGRKEQAALEKNFKEVLQFCPHVPVLMVSAMKQVGLGRIVPLAAQIREECNTRIGTGALNRAMEEVLTKHQPPVVKRSRPKFFYLTQAEVAPPTFVFFVSDADRVSETYARYLDRSLRKIFRIEHAPIRVRLRSSHKKKSE